VGRINLLDEPHTHPALGHSSDAGMLGNPVAYCALQAGFSLDARIGLEGIDPKTRINYGKTTINRKKYKIVATNVKILLTDFQPRIKFENMLILM
jgi:hypothetical protein